MTAPNFVIVLVMLRTTTIAISSVPSKLPSIPPHVGPRITLNRWRL